MHHSTDNTENSPLTSASYDGGEDKSTDNKRTIHGLPKATTGVIIILLRTLIIGTGIYTIPRLYAARYAYPPDKSIPVKRSFAPEGFPVSSGGDAIRDAICLYATSSWTQAEALKEETIRFHCNLIENIGGDYEW